MCTHLPERIDLKKDLADLEHHYAALLAEHGDTPGAAQWSSLDTQEQRMRILCEIGNLQQSRVLDFGCGTGHLLTFMRRELMFEGEYIGYDLSEAHLQIGRAKHPGSVFKQTDILAHGVTDVCDYAIINGVFSNKLSDNWTFMVRVLDALRPSVARGIAFNCLSKYVDYEDDNLFYVDPSRVFEFCKQELSPLVTVRHDYRLKQDVVPYEFTVYIYFDGR